MISIGGTYFDGKTSRPHKAKLCCHGDVVTITGEDDPLYCSIRLSQCRLDMPLGKTDRSIGLPGGAVFVTAEFDHVSAIEQLAGKNRGMRFVNRMELRWKTVGAALAGIIFFVWLFHSYAIPFLAKKIALAIPASLSENISHQTMQVLDSNFFKPSLLGREKTEPVRKSFDQLARGMGPDASIYRLEFRKSPVIGPNAFALPSGTIVLTDELVEISKDERELDGILLHEMAHVRERHGLRTIIQNAGIFLVVAALSGDLTEISATAASLPTLLAHSGYSRAFEREADGFAALSLLRKGLPVQPFEDILRRITGKAANYPGKSVFSSHPATEERVAYIEALRRSGSIKNPN